jgi:hypothetical protein
LFRDVAALLVWKEAAQRSRRSSYGEKNIKIKDGRLVKEDETTRAKGESAISKARCKADWPAVRSSSTTNYGPFISQAIY